MAGSRGRRSREKRVLMTVAEEKRFEKIVQRFRRSSETKLTSSHLIRAMIHVVDMNQARIAKQLSLYELARPANEDRRATKELEEALAEIIVEALHR